jgi:hypothetical protein
MKNWKIVVLVLLFTGMSSLSFSQNEKAGTKPIRLKGPGTPEKSQQSAAGIQRTRLGTAQWKDKEPGTREITIVEDRDQTYMTSKVYVLQHTKAVDLRPFVDGAVRRFNSESNVQRLNYSAGGKQYLVVNMALDMVPYIDDMVKKLDRQTKDPKKDTIDGSIISGTGIYRFSYQPQFRASQEMLNVFSTVGFAAAEAAYFLDPASNTFYWKNSYSDGIDGLNWMKILDRPIPQVEFKINMYEINMNSLRELGIDFIRLKNGPGADLLNFGTDLFSFKADEQFMGKMIDLISKGSHSWTGFLIAPDFDGSFIRLLAQKGNAKVATSNAMSVATDYTDPGNVWANARYRFTFTPEYQNISKNATQEITVANDSANTYQFHLRSPVICYNGKIKKKEDAEAATMTFGWVLGNGSVLERDNNGAETINPTVARSFATINPGVEKLIAAFDRQHDVNQNNGIPFLSEIPGFKYIFGSTSDSQAHYKIFITAETTPLPPKADLSQWAGRVITFAEMIKDENKKKKRRKKSPIKKKTETVEQIK